MRPPLSIILPTYNRARFLPHAWASIRAQTWTDWELIVVDDGSTDDTPAIVQGWQQEHPAVRYLHQPNGGAYSARNLGLDTAQGDFVAFFDSDDAWLPHHLRDCLDAFQSNPDVDWVYGACRMVDWETRRTIEPNTFFAAGQPRPFRRLRTQTRNALHVIDDAAATACMIRFGLMCGLQCSVLRRRVVADLRFPPYRIGEDQIFVVQALKAGFRFAYLDQIHVDYHIHAGNVSAASSEVDVGRRQRGTEVILTAYEALPHLVSLSAAEHRALRRRLAEELFWNLGYCVHWEHRQDPQALAQFRKGLRMWPWDWRCWKTYLAAQVRTWRARPVPGSDN